jgi:hypothetical protein
MQILIGGKKVNQTFFQKHKSPPYSGVFRRHKSPPYRDVIRRHKSPPYRPEYLQNLSPAYDQIQTNISLNSPISRAMVFPSQYYEGCGCIRPVRKIETLIVFKAYYAHWSAFLVLLGTIFLTVADLIRFCIKSSRASLRLVDAYFNFSFWVNTS